MIEVLGATDMSVGWIWNYAVVQVTQPGIENIGYKYFIVWAVLNFTWFWTVYCKLTMWEQNYG